jgi:hypothetical protein
MEDASFFGDLVEVFRIRDFSSSCFKTHDDFLNLVSVEDSCCDVRRRPDDDIIDVSLRQHIEDSLIESHV